MISGQDLLRRRSRAEGRTFLSAADPAIRRGRIVEVRVRDIRESPRGINSPALLDFEAITVDGQRVETACTSINLNFGNLRKLIELAGDDLSVCRGAALIFELVPVNNPNFNERRDSPEMAETIGYSLVDWRPADLPAAPPPAAAAESAAAGRKGGRR